MTAQIQAEALLLAINLKDPRIIFTLADRTIVAAELCRLLDRIAELEALQAAPPAPAAIEALRQARSVIGSINKGPAHKVAVNDEAVFWQRGEWIEWAVNEVLPLIDAALAAAPAQAVAVPQVITDAMILAAWSAAAPERAGDITPFHAAEMKAILSAGIGAAPAQEHATQLAGQGLRQGVWLKPARAGRVYVAGPMTGLPEFNFPAFNAKAAELRAGGWHVENPAEHGHVEGAEWADYLHYDIGRMATCSTIHLLPGWCQSRGAALEVHVASVLGMEFQYAEGAEIYHAPAQAQEDARDEWEGIDTLPNSDDLIWLYCQDTNTTDGPAIPSPSYADSWTHWAFAEAPSTTAIDAARAAQGVA